MSGGADGGLSEGGLPGSRGGTPSHNLAEPEAGAVGGRKRKIDGRYPMSMTRFTYEHRKDTFRDFQKYLSGVGVIPQKHKTRGRKILVPLPPQEYGVGKHEIWFFFGPSPLTPRSSPTPG